MQYRTFAKTGENISLFGLGTMRLPQDANGTVNEAEAIKMIRTAIDGGVNYVDTAYMYHNGDSEIITGKALQDGYREKVLLADKMPVWLAKEESDLQRIFDTQLQRLGDSMIDMYLLHNITVPIWRRAQKFNTLDFFERKRAEGRIKHIGFSFHDALPFFKEVIDSYPWDFCQIQLNYMDVEFQAGVEGLKYAASKGIPVVIMEPLRGGKLTDRLPESISRLWEQAEVRRTPAEWALRWVADFPEVLTVLNGVSSMDQLLENMGVLGNARANSLTEKEHAIIGQAANVYRGLTPYHCTECKYCMPCPSKVNIPETIGYYNDWLLYAQNEKIKVDFNTFIREANRPSKCTGCKACEEHCPQHIPIAQAMEKAAGIFE